MESRLPIGGDDQRGVSGLGSGKLVRFFAAAYGDATIVPCAHNGLDTVVMGFAFFETVDAQEQPVIDAIQICSFDPRYQDAAATLINASLGERFGGIADPTLNPDLHDIAKSYKSGEFVLALHQDQLVGTGALIPEGRKTGRIARMHTLSRYRRLGVGTRVLQELERRAQLRGLSRLVLETNASWRDAISFYLKHGYVELRRRAEGGETAVNFHKTMPRP